MAATTAAAAQAIVLLGCRVQKVVGCLLAVVEVVLLLSVNIGAVVGSVVEKLIGRVLS